MRNCDQFDESTTPKSSIAVLHCLVRGVNALLPFALRDSFRGLNKSKDKNIHGESTAEKRSNADDQKSSSSLLNFTSEIKAMFSEACCSLNLFESHLKKPSQETAKRLKLLFDRGKDACNDFFTAAAENIDLRFLFNALPSLKVKKCSQDNNNDNDNLIHDQEQGKIPTTSKGDSQNNENEAYQYNFQSKIKELQRALVSLRKKLESLTAKNCKLEETLFELGKFTVEETAKRNEERKSKIFHQIYHSPLSGVKRSLLSSSTGTPINDTLGYPKDFHDVAQPKRVPVSRSAIRKMTTASGNPPVLNTSLSVSLNKQSASGAETPLQGSVSSTFSGNSENSIPATPNSSVITSSKKANGERGSTQSDDGDATSNMGMTSQQNFDDLSFSVQQHDSGMECITLANKPATSVATTLYNNYKLLLLTLAQRFLSSEVVMLKDWASQNFSIVNPQNATDVLFQLDEKRVINASDLGQLCYFFESIIRFDLVHIVDAFLLGDYSLLRQNTASKSRSTNGAQNSRPLSTPRSMDPGQYSINAASTGIISSQASKPQNRCGGQNSVPRQTQQGASLNVLNPGNRFSRFANEKHSINAEQPNLKLVATEFTSSRKIDMGVNESPQAVTRETRTMTANTSPPANTSTRKNAQIVISNGSKHSKFQRPNTKGTDVFNLQSCGVPRHQNLDHDDNWLCSHYKRHCYVKFQCCDKFWPCHRCHNSQSTCGQKKLKSRDTKMVQCVYCNKVQQFGEHCCNCGAKFASYFCELCKHLTGEDDHPYHCEKCGICRIHGDRSFHCDVCGVCLDVQLRGNHKCREGSAHDECCICLEDAFTGCQILPCSHKVHKECATQMIRSGITRCPICRESFAHKLERRPFPNSRKRAGK